MSVLYTEHSSHKAKLQQITVVFESITTSFIESVLTFAFICWYHNLGVKNKNSLRRIVGISSKIIGERQRDLSSFCDHQILRKTNTILADPSHALYSEFELLPSGRHFRCPPCKTNRKRNSFLAVAIRLLNKTN